MVNEKNSLISTKLQNVLVFTKDKSEMEYLLESWMVLREKFPLPNFAFSNDSARVIKEIKQKSDHNRVDLLIYGISVEECSNDIKMISKIKKINPLLTIHLTNTPSDEYFENIFIAQCPCVEGYTCGNIRSYELADILESINYKLNLNKQGLYILVAPSGYGKSTLMNNLRFVGVRVLKKITTRPQRLNEITSFEVESISSEEFEYLEQENELLITYSYKGNKYGIRLNDFYLSVSNEWPYMYATGDFEMAIDIAKRFPFNAKLITLDTPLDFAGFGLETRLNQLQIAGENLKAEGMDSRSINKKLAELSSDAKIRLRGIVEQARKMIRYLPQMDLILEDTELNKRFYKVLEFIYHRRYEPQYDEETKIVFYNSSL